MILTLDLTSLHFVFLECIVSGFENCLYRWTSLVAEMVNCLSTMRETWVRSLGWEDTLEKEMATHSSTLALKIPWTEELGAGYCPWGRKESSTTERLHFLSIGGKAHSLSSVGCMLFIKNLVVSGLAGHVVSVAAVQFCHCSAEAAIGRWTN